ncbi:ribosomal protein S18-alanine N-acetyltransferase [Synechococcus elongatus]|uniref:Ribosomal-protein-alanine acetyltransferase n=1 Tax=Synechococcus elongatus (strain ATCC 33912 / PCC 7942 / FACHB-805) TaxID=1140 RepID=Q31RM6_SYNE7|nr:ribosomal protein S18-alanine N-acetyltransferase [Synechococcus elongatus]MBD2689193.1 ribosomal protein S18-alanine N-acetyltransferase [Synechococcus elongatus FACHB-1061]ABB56293.1 ribosomal-protein-alanine acetyltransferase [Synechococcus elongatus PCC 7942 = FACHB-805]AJD56658.1 alanine acetyltransferase [Synechococcus elongatus UTEX 2973]MBD2588125.1 ribosomal protein S18-alanine N-acetyltransferase [Synechococcus elongatus FACHB-242]MBD2707167.1 ribosomal protein S18-alanine N-acety
MYDPAPLCLSPLALDQVEAARHLDEQTLGGFWAIEAYRREVESDASDLLGLWQGAHLIGLGCSWAIVDEAHITLLAIAPSHQQQGLGGFLLLALLQAAIRRDMAWATLEVRVSNQVAIALYQSLGFQEVGQRPSYYADTGEAARILWLKGLRENSVQEAIAQQWKARQQRLNRQGWQLQLPMQLATACTEDPDPLATTG